MSGTAQLTRVPLDYLSNKHSNVGPVYDYAPGTYPEGSDDPKVPPQMNISHPDITCGRRAFDSAAKTETADVLAGSEVGFRVSWDGNGPYGKFWHPGPGQIYMSRAPNDDLEHYQGDGDWFKIAYGGPVGNNEWLLWGEHDVSFSLLFSSRLSLIAANCPLPTSSTLPSRKRPRRASTCCASSSGCPPTSSTTASGTSTAPTSTLSAPAEGRRRDSQSSPAHTTSMTQVSKGYHKKKKSLGARSNSSSFPSSLGLWIPKDQFVNGGFVPDSEMKLLDYKAPGPAVWTG